MAQEEEENQVVPDQNEDNNEETNGQNNTDQNQEDSRDNNQQAESEIQQSDPVQGNSANDREETDQNQNKNKSDLSTRPNYLNTQTSGANNNSQYASGISLVSSRLDSQIPKEFGNSLYKVQSSSTLMHSINSYTIPKQGRFNTQESLKANGSMYNLKTTLAARGTTLGYGNRGIFSRKMINELASKPGPNHYAHKSDIGPCKQNYGKTFGLSYAHYAKVIPPGQRDCLSLEESKNIPGPGTYTTTKNFAKEKPEYTVRKKGKMFNENSGVVSPGCKYNNNHNLVESNRFDGTSFGYGNKIDVTKTNTRDNPGPGNYKLPSIFDKFYSK